MKLHDWISVMEGIAPPDLALEWDNAGLIVGPEKTDIRSVLVALDCTPEVAREAADRGAGLVLTHHPQLFHPVKRLLFDAPDTAAACILLRHGIGHYAAHTNLDAAKGGVNDVLAALFGVEGVPFSDGIGRVGALPAPETLGAFAVRVGKALDTTVRVVGDAQTILRRAAFVGGAGGMDLLAAKEAGADVLVTGEIKHNEALDALFIGLSCVVAGHDETERIILKPLIERLQRETDDVQYNLAQSDKRPFAAVQEEDI
jgi:dinuclear metal center YbgI/SA1388 family protein